MVSSWFDWRGQFRELQQMRCQQCFRQKADQRGQKTHDASQKANGRDLENWQFAGFAQKQQDDGSANQNGAKRQQGQAAIDQPAPVPESAQFVIHPGGAHWFDITAFKPAFKKSGPVDDPCQSPCHGTDHAGYGSQQKNRGDSQLYAVGHGRKVGRKIHPDSDA
ncbi:hypothetical protein IWX87_002582 [Polaromonas sp. CG_9.7]|nr:hypothetical protein [Polaromonas sp. CG_9.7]MBG6114818.1 hypothetical protein [Polaromonas sp. CG_9.2]MDH6184664.1 hypothetical protein [Polaromonas sp. CG_23.6]